MRAMLSLATVIALFACTKDGDTIYQWDSQ